MSDLILEHLKRIQGDLTDIKREVRDVKSEVIFVRSIIGDLIKADARREASYASLEVRIERLESRMDIQDIP